jgi:hypothetical protein
MRQRGTRLRNTTQSNTEANLEVQQLPESGFSRQQKAQALKAILVFSHLEERDKGCRNDET